MSTRQQGAGRTHDATHGMCALQCGKRVAGDNSSKEHVIPKSIGGRVWVSGFICRSCNSKTGQTWDAALAEQLNPLSLLLGINRQGGSVPPQVFPTSDGQNVQIHPDGTRTIAKPSVDITRSEDTTQVKISARSRKEMRKYLKGVLKKHPSDRRSINDLMSEVRDVPSYSPAWTEIALDFEGEDTGRSLVKSALALVHQVGASHEVCNRALEYLLNEGTEPCFGWYYDKNRDLVSNRPRAGTFHCVYVKGNASTGTILGYIEYFGIHRLALLLSDSYSGKDFDNVYAIDPVSGKRIELALGVEVGDVRSALDCEREDWTVKQGAIANLMEYAVNKDFERALSATIEEAVGYAFANSGAEPGEELTDSQVQQLIDDVVKKMEPFILHNSERFGIPFGDASDSSA